MTRRLGQITQREHTPTAGEREARCAVHRQEVEEDRIAGLHLEAPDVVCLTVCLDVGQLTQRAFREPLGLVVEEGPRNEPRAAVRAGDLIDEAAFMNWIDR